MMKTRTNLFRELNGSTLLSTSDHSIVTRAVGWGEPQTLSAGCFCGWQSLYVEEEFEGYGPLIPELRPFMDKYGENALNLGKSVSGNHSTVVRMCLEHLDLPLAELLRANLPNLDDLRDQLQTQQLSSEAAEDLRALAERLIILTAALEIMATVPLPKLEPVSDEVIAEYNEIIEKVRLRG